MRNSKKHCSTNLPRRSLSLSSGSFMIPQETGVGVSVTAPDVRTTVSNTRFKQTVGQTCQTQITASFLGSNWPYPCWACATFCFCAQTASCSLSLVVLNLFPVFCVLRVSYFRGPEPQHTRKGVVVCTSSTCNCWHRMELLARCVRQQQPALHAGKKSTSGMRDVLVHLFSVEHCVAIPQHL